MSSILLSLSYVLLIPLALGIYFLIFFILVPVIRISQYKNRKDAETFFYPISGSAVRMKKDFLEKDDILASLKSFNADNPGKNFSVSNYGSKIVFTLRNTSYIKEFLLKPNNYKKADFAQTLVPLLGNGLLLAEGATWKNHRKIVSSSFNYEFLKSNVGLIQNTAQEFFEKLTPDQYSNYIAIKEIQKVTGEVIGRIFFGEKLNEYTLEGKPLTLVLAALISDLCLCLRDPLAVILGANLIKYPILPKYAKVAERVQNFRDICKQIVIDKKARRNTTTDSTDLLSMLLITQNSADAEYKFTDEEIVDEFVTFFVAGMDTTGHLIGMTLYLLTQHPEYLAELQHERKMAFKETGRMNSENLQDLDLLHCILKETIRLYTPAGGTFTRTALEDHSILDLNVKKGDLIRVGFINSFFDEKNFEEPYKFNPNRWRNNEKKLDPYAFTPFSAGPRNCIGQHLSILEAKIVLTEFLERFDFKLKDGYKLRMLARFLYEPADDVPLILSRKECTA